MLTKDQLAILRILEDAQDDGEACPSYEELAEALGLRSKSGVSRLVLALEQRGYIRRLPNRARAIEVIRSADGTWKEWFVRSATFQRYQAAISELEHWRAEAMRLAKLIGCDPIAFDPRVSETEEAA